MKNIWSENKYVNTTINILMFLMATNFLHFGYLLLPVICLLIFVNNRYKFYVNNLSVFVLLCLFGISFLLFSYKLGIYCVMGLFLPLAYYVGSNIIEINEKKIKYIIYLLMFGMITHVLLNFGYELLSRGFEMFTRNSHLDIWTLDEYPTTQTAVNYVFLFSVIYYIYVYEDNKKVKNMYTVLLILAMIYEIALARRTPIFILIISALLSLIIDKMINKNNSKKFRKIIIFFVCVLVLGILYYKFIFKPGTYRHNLSIFNKLFLFGLDPTRINIFIEAIEIAPQHLWGGQEISVLFGINVHDLWMDVYDYAGIVPCIILIICSVYCFIKLFEILKNKQLTRQFKLLVFVLFVVITMQMCLEPIITGSPIFLLCTIIAFSSIECLQAK